MIRCSLADDNLARKGRVIEMEKQRMSPEHSKVLLSIGSASDRDEMCRLLSAVFCRHDPPAVATGITPTEFEAFVRLLCPKAEAEGLTLVARCASTGELMGTLLAEDSMSDQPQGMENLSEKFQPIFDILGQLYTDYHDFQSLRLGEWLHLFLLGVDRRFAGQGVAKRLVAASLENGARRGYRVAVTEATNKTSQHIFRKQGFVERVQRSYRDHRFEGQAVFASIAGEGGPILMDKKLAPNRGGES